MGEDGFGYWTNDQGLYEQVSVLRKGGVWDIITGQ